LRLKGPESLNKISKNYQSYASNVVNMRYSSINSYNQKNQLDYNINKMNNDYKSLNSYYKSSQINNEDEDEDDKNNYTSMKLTYKLIKSGDKINENIES